MNTEGTTKKENHVGQSDESARPLTKMNFILMGVSAVLIVVGFMLMGGSANDGQTFNADIFSTLRTAVAPTISFVGFVMMFFAILYKKR